MTPGDDELGVVISNPCGRNISTVFVILGCSVELLQEMEWISSETEPSEEKPQETISEVSEEVASALGLTSFQVFVTVGNERKRISKCADNMSDSEYAVIVNLLRAFQDTI